MRKNAVRALALLGAVSWPVMAAAQIVAPAPVRQSVDANGVDLFAGTLNVRSPAATIGGGRGQGMAYFFVNTGAGWADNITAALNETGTIATVRLGARSDDFTDNGGGTFTSNQGHGATLTVSGSTYTYTSSDGTVVHFSNAQANTAPYYANLGRTTDITRASGVKLLYNYQNTETCTRSKPGSDGDICLAHKTIYRLSSVTNSYGYSLNINYQSDDLDPDEVWITPPPWSIVTNVSLFNLENTGAGQNSLAGSRATSTFTVTDTLNRTTSYRMNGGQVLGITPPGRSSESVTVGYDSNQRVSSVASAAGTWTYSYTDPGDGTRHTTVTAPSNVATQHVFDLASQRMTSMTDGLGNTSRWAYDTSGRLTDATAPERNAVHYDYDTRGNVTATTYHAKPGSGLADIVTHAAYDATCDNTITCNQPN